MVKWNVTPPTYIGKWISPYGIVKVIDSYLASQNDADEDIPDARESEFTVSRNEIGGSPYYPNTTMVSDKSLVIMTLKICH
jgi:hypothetical protein